MFGVINRIFLNFNFWRNLIFAGLTFPFAADCEKAVDKQPSNKANNKANNKDIFFISLSFIITKTKKKIFLIFAGIQL